MRVPEEFEKFQATVTHCSRDDAHHRSLIESEKTVADFDAVKNDYAVRHGLQMKPCSADALFLDEQDRYVLAEFKSGGVDVKELMRKIYESALILAEEKQVPVEWLRDHVCFVLVNPRVVSKHEDVNDAARRTLAKALSQEASREVRVRIPKHVIGFFYRNAVEMTPERFTQTFLKA